jgi:hypothetical protein
MNPDSPINPNNSKPVNIENFYHDTGNGRIFCTLITPPHPTQECAIYFAPLFEERMWAQRIAFNFARDMAAKDSRATLVFDYHGYGESDGDADDFTLARCRDDVMSLHALMRTRGYSRFVWWGIRTGCSIALATIPAHAPITSFILWAPVLRLKDYIYESLRANLAAQMMMFKKVVVQRDIILKELVKLGQCCRDSYVLNHVDGYRFGGIFYQEILNLNNSKDLSCLTFPSLVVDVIPPRTENGKHLAKAESTGEVAPTQQNIQYRQVSEREFWLINRDYSQRAESVYRATLEWLGAQVIGSKTEEESL